MSLQDYSLAIFNAAPTPSLILQPESPDFIVADVNEAYLQAYNIRRGQLTGKRLSEIFNETPVNFTENSKLNLSASLRYVLEEKRTHKIDLQRFAHHAVDSSGSLLTYCQVTNTPIFNPYGSISYILHTTEDITKQVLMKNALQTNEEQYQSLFNQNPDPVFSLDRNGYFTSVNQAAVQLSGFNAEDLLTMHFTDLCEAEDVSRINGYFNESLQGKAFSFRMPSVSVSGKRCELSLTVMPVIVENQTQGIYGIAKDITERVRLQQEKDLVARLSKIFTAELGMKDCLDLALKELCAYTRVEIGEAWLSNIDNKELKLFSRVCMDGGIAEDDHTCWKSEDGLIGQAWKQKKTAVLDYFATSTEWIRKTYSENNKLLAGVGVPIIFKEQVIAVLGFYTTNRDVITESSLLSPVLIEQLASHLQRKKSEQEFSQYFELSPDMLCIVGYDGYFKRVNPSFTRVLGFSDEELLSIPITELVHPEDIERTNRAIYDLVTNIKPYCSIENRYITKNGDVVWMSWTSNSLEQEQLIYAVARDITEKKDLEKAMVNEQLRFQRLFKEAPVSMCILKGKDHIIESVNSMYYKYTAAKDLLGKPVVEIFPEEKVQPFQQWLDDVYETGETLTRFETLFHLNTKGDGNLQEVYLNFMYQPFKNSAGQTEGIFYFGVDVTEQVQARKKLEESEKQYIDLIQNLPAAVFTTDAKGALKLYNKEMITLLGFHPEIGKPILSDDLQIFTPDFMPIGKGHSPMEITLRTGVPVRGKRLIVKQPGGKYRYVLPFPSAVVDANGRLAGGVNVIIDVTEQKHSEEELRKLSLIAKQTNDAVIITDPQGNIEWVNEAFTSMTEFSSDEVLGKSPSLLHGPDTNPSVVSFMNDKINKQKPFGCEILKYTKSGRPFWVEVKHQPLFDAQGSLTHYFNIEADISDRKEAYEKLMRSEREIRKFARQQNAIMEKERARIAREIHDEFGQQLSGLKMSLSSLKKQFLNNPANAEAVLKSLISDVDQSIQLLREFATELRPGILDTLGLFPSITWLVNDFKKKTGIKAFAKFNVSEDQFVNESLSICFFRICQEALTNIVRHAEATEVHLGMELNDDILTMSITDNGKGIVQDKINNPFSMGLLGMRERAGLVGGELLVTCDPKNGTTVHFSVNINNE